MSEQNKTDDKSSQAVPAIAVAALVVSLFAAQEIILKPTRPGMINTESASTEDVRARLWQDPFQAVETYREQFYSQIRSTQEQTITLKYPDSEETFQIESTKKNQSVTFKDETGKAFHIENKFKRLVCSSEKHPETIAHSIKELRCQVYEKIKEKEKSVHVLAVMMPGGPYAENHEWRLRSRHALIYGLRAAGYSPVDATHIGFVDFENACLNATKKEGEQRKQEISYCGFPDFMPYEWFEFNERLKPIDIEKLSGKNEFKLSSNDKKERVLIVWLNNDTFTHRSINSIDMLDRLKKEILPTSEIEEIDESKISFNIIGPNSSGTLKRMYADIRKINSSENSLEHNYFFVNAVTADQRRLIGGTTKDPSKKLLDNDQVKRLNDKVIRTISTQEELVNTLLCELALRGVTPYRPDPNEPIAEKCPDVAGALPSRQSDKPHHMVLIGELDTFYSQALTEVFLDRTTEFGGGKENNQNNNHEHIHTFNYLRGLDGITSEQAATSQGSKNKESQTNKLSDKELKEQQERPTETSQLDYLLRLGERIAQLDKEKSSVGGIQAIGITGGDTYDKLLILQALRPKFPKTLFFTTDLDARLFDSSEIESTRNLIVASPFGLQLNGEWQRDAPPFRDNYQTALYFTTLLALHFPHTETEAKTKEQGSVSSLKEFLEDLRKKPRLFEIGNDGAVDLSHTAGNGIHPDPEFTSVSKAADWEYILKISGPLLIATILVFFLTFLAPISFRPNIVRVFNCLIFLILVIICFQIPVIVAIILLAFLLQFLVPVGVKPIIIGVVISIVLLLISYHIFPLSDGYGSEPLASGTSIWPANAIKFVAIILAGCFLIIIYQELKKDEEEIEIKYISKDGKKKYPSSASSGENDIALVPIIHDSKHPFSYEWASLKNIFKNKQFRTQINETTKNFWTRLNIDQWEIDSGEEPPSFKDLWSDYFGLRTIFWSLVITIIMFLLFCGFVGWLFMMDLLHIPEIPFRGNVSLRIHYITLILAALFYLILIFLIVDITHLCSHFIDLLSGHDVRWPDDLVRINKSKYNLPREAVEHKILFDFIHQHTRTINKFIYYPFFILFLILLSRSNYFDNWQITSFLLFFFGFTALIALSSVINLRIAAQDARERILEKLDNYSLQLMENKARYKHDDSAAKLKLLTQEMKDFEEGVFQPLSRHPIVLSVLIPLSSIAGVYLFDYLSLAFR